jgi:hypothetical protein
MPALLAATKWIACGLSGPSAEALDLVAAKRAWRTPQSLLGSRVSKLISILTVDSVANTL